MAGTWLSVLALATLSPGLASARTVRMQASAPLEDFSERAVEAAIERAVDRCFRSADSTGLSWARVEDASVLADRVVVRVLASDEEAGDHEEVTVLDLAGTSITTARN